MTQVIKTSYPATDTVALTITLASLATSSTLLVGRQSSVVDNTTNVDLDHILSGLITVGTTPTANTFIEVWVTAPVKIVSGSATYPDSFGASDAAFTSSSAGVKAASFRRAARMLCDSATSNRGYYFPGVSIASLFGGQMPKYWGVFVTHSTAVNLNATAGNHYLHYDRIQAQAV